jgi:predicted ATPase
MFRIKIQNFKSIENLDMELAPVTLLIGPPACGKSNILEALTFAGYMSRLNVLDKEYGNVGTNLEPPQQILRFSSHEQFFKNYDLTRRVSVEIVGNKVKNVIELYYEKGQPRLKVNNILIPWVLSGLPGDPMTAARNELKKAESVSPLIEAKLYGFDRYGLNMSFHSYVKTGSAYPQNILSELGRNAMRIMRIVQDVIIDINNTIVSELDLKTEFQVLRSGAITLFDHYYEVDPVLSSDTLFRVLYYLSALRSSLNYVKIHGLEKRLLILLEEPEAHSFPYFFDMLVKAVERVSEIAYVILTTHNSMLVSKLWEGVKNLKTYYVYRDSYGGTKSIKLDVSKLAKDLSLPDEIMLMPVKEVVERYSVRLEKVEAGIKQGTDSG